MKSDPNGVFLSTRDSNLARVNLPLSCDLEAALAVNASLGSMSRGLHTTTKGFTLWCV